MKKRSYRAQKVNQIPWKEMTQRVKEKGPWHWPLR
jgi:transposase